MKNNANFRERDGELDLSMSDLKEAPIRDIARAKKATSVDLSNNSLTSLGKNFASLTHLVKLDLSKNLLTSLPENFGDLVLLKHLDLFSNKLNHLPLSFGSLKNLRWLDLKNNPLVPALQNVAGPCLDAQQCQNCAKRVVQVIAESQRRVEQERLRVEQERKEKEMADKAAAKKENQKNKKNNKNEKKKNENGIKAEQNQPKQNQKKKDKSKQAKVNKPSGSSFLGRLFKRLFKTALLISIVLIGLYYYDIEKFKELKGKAIVVADSAVALLPPQTFVLLNQTSTFLNTDPRVKNHWANLKDIAVVVNDKVCHGVSTVLAVLPVYVNDLKRLILQSTNSTKT